MSSIAESLPTTEDQEPTTSLHHREGPIHRQTSGAFAVCYNHCFFNSLEGLLYRILERRLTQAVRDFLLRHYNLDLAKIVVEQPPKVDFGEYATPIAFELARKLRMLTPHKWSGNPGGTAVSTHILTALGIDDNPRQQRITVHICMGSCADHRAGTGVGGARRM